MPMVTGYAFRQEQMAYPEFNDIPVRPSLPHPAMRA